MPAEQDKFQKAVEDALEVVMFENWLRFYFISGDEESGLRLELPDKSLERIRELYPSLYPLADKMNGKAVDFEISRNSVLAHLAEEVEGRTIPKGELQKVLQSATFQARLELFHTWEQIHEDQLDQGFAEFGAWRKLFARWLETPGARELEEKLLPRAAQ